MSESLAWLLVFILAVLVILGAIIRRGFRPQTRKRAALIVSSSVKSVLTPKAPVLAELLHRRMATRGIAAVGAEPVSDRVEAESSDGESNLLASARALGADYGLVVSLDDLNCQVDESRMQDLGKLRVNTTLCVAYRLFEIGHGRLLAGQTLAFCRRTSPIVSGTAVGNDVLDGLMREVADRIDQQFESLHLSV